MRKKKQPPMKRGGDGFTDRERAFIRERRADPSATGADIAKRAGYAGDHAKLGRRATGLMRKVSVARAVMAPDPRPAEKLDDAAVKEEIRRLFLSLIRDPRITPADKIRAGDKLMATIEGGYVPVQVRSEGTLTLESWVTRMGGAPPAQLSGTAAEEAT